MDKNLITNATNNSSIRGIEHAVDLLEIQLKAGVTGDDILIYFKDYIQRRKKEYDLDKEEL